jgi:hypothetical protein
LNFPVPPLTLAELGGSKSYIVVDGKQRLTTLSQFFGLMASSKFNEFRLSGLTELAELNGLNINDIRDNHPGHFRSIENYSIRTNVVRGWHRDEVLYSIFLRLNSGSVKLSPQELRQALNPGEFTNWISDYTADSPSLRSILSNTEPDFRMRDIELMIRYLGLHFFLEDYRGDLKKFLDGVARSLNRDWPTIQSSVQQQAAIFEDAYGAIASVFGDNAFQKWNGDRWEGRLNRAIFDVMMFYLNERSQIDMFIEHGDNIVAAFKRLCESNPKFRESIETTTKSIEAVATRLGEWGKVLQSHGVVNVIVELDSNSNIKNAVQ